MAQVNITIHGKPYGISCDEGQEDRVVEVGQYVDVRARDIASAGAASNENHLLVLTALVLADEVKDLQEQLDHMKQQVARQENDTATDGDNRMNADQESQILKIIEGLQGRLDSVSERLGKA